MVLQEINKTYPTTLDLAKVYYSILMKVNSIHITENELLLLSFCAIKGTISTPPVREEFISTFDIPKNTVFNMVSKLKKLRLLIKDPAKKIRVNPKLVLDFSQPLLLAIKMETLE